MLVATTTLTLATPRKRRRSRPTQPLEATVLDAGGEGSGAVLLVWDGPLDSEGGKSKDGEVVPREEPLRTGDFLGFKAGVEGIGSLGPSVNWMRGRSTSNWKRWVSFSIRQ